MIDFNTAINLVQRNGGFKSNKREDSYYRTYKIQDSKPIQVRISNHGTHLWTWINRDYNPSKAINICVVFSENGTHNSNVQVDMDLKYRNRQGESIVIGQRQSFEVIQYVYNCQLLDNNDGALINQEIQKISQTGIFQDPLTNTLKHAKIYKLTPNQKIEIIKEDINLKTQNINNMKQKQVIRLNESDLHSIVKETVNKIMTEISTDLVDKAANSAYKKAREGFGLYEPYNEIPHDSYHGKKFAQGEKFLKYRNNRLNKGNEDIGIAYVGDQLVLKNYKTGKILTKPCDSIEELESEILN
ncbi:MAG: hypothetical protein IKY35_05370 [Muribaculaceae bacterium]|nr:hypothetical protein [Muribaculaceae bacterium]